MQYTWGFGVQQGMFSTLGDIMHEYSKGISGVHWGCSVKLRGYHEYTVGYYDKYVGRSLGKQLRLYGNPSVLNIPRCTHGIPHTHHASSQFTHGIPVN